MVCDDRLQKIGPVRGAAVVLKKIYASLLTLVLRISPAPPISNFFSTSPLLSLLRSFIV